VNVDRRWWETSVVRGRVLAAGLVLLVAGCGVLGLSAHVRLTPTTAAKTPTAGGIESAPGLLPASLTSSIGGQSQRQARSLFAGLPLTFEPNQGQGNLDPVDPRAKFVAHGSGYSLFLGTQGAILSLVSRDQPKSADKDKTAPTLTLIESVEMKLAGANANLNPTASEPLPGKSNYLIGNDPSKWRRAVPQFARVQYQDVYPGINLVFYGNQGRLEYDFQVAPGADPAQAELEFNGAKKLEVEDGALVIRSDADSVRLEAPQVYQEIAGKKQMVEGRFVLRGKNHVGFSVGAYDRSRELIIDPILNFSTYFGGSGDEHTTSVAVDGSLNIYITGSTTSPNLPFTAGVIQTGLNGAEYLCGQDYSAVGLDRCSSRLRDLPGRKRNRQSRRNRGGWWRGRVRGGNNFVDELPNDLDDRLPDRSRDWQHRHVARVCVGAEQRTNANGSFRTLVFDLPVGQWNRCCQWNDD
jgi:hypothetical protein